MLDESYAIEIARDWNTIDAASGYAGFVTSFEVRKDAIAQYPVQVVGARTHRELWIPADDLPNFNTGIIGFIRTTYAFFGDRFVGNRTIDSVLHTEKEK